MNKYKARMYMVEDGIPNMPDSFFRALWEAVLQDGSDYWLNFSGTINSGDDFLELVKDPSVLFTVVLRGDKVVAFTWTTEQRGRTAKVHFCTLSEVWGRGTIAIGKYVLSYYSKFFDSLTGYTPTENELACKFVQLIGMKHVGILPNGGWDSILQDSCDMQITHIDFKGGSDGREQRS